ncbi:hypothetical protein RJ639_039167 [Escallonia herrerae]|uniref:Insecticidal crystal toxin domain-containing protein n=1 Tax=Escallonia herrerae TaxID=1293975 RepID=A0AA88WZS9_9ASTE|nr:hypothetical protein RJ639_039167 [Escallonia herrerae]
MYVTRPLSQYSKFPETLSQPPEGPNSGFLVLQDEEAETYCCFGLCKNRDLLNLPFPQNKNLTIRYTTGGGENRRTSYYDVALVPVLNQPLSSNRYYAIKPHGTHKGEAYTCSKEEDMSTCCFCRCITDIKPRPLNPHDIYQQFEIAASESACNRGGSFSANSLAPDGFPPHLLRRKHWQIHTKTPKNYQLGEASGVDHSLRVRLPEFSTSFFDKSSEAVIVGKWYCPFMFIKDGTLRDQMKRSMFYEMTLEQQWEQIFSAENEISKGSTVFVDAAVQKDVVMVAGTEAIWDEKNVVDGAVWFKNFGSAGEQISVGLSTEIVQRMRWEQERAGWVGREERLVRVKREEVFAGAGGWRRFGCHVLVERFVLKRMDGSLVMTYDFKHTHQIRTKWE